MIDHWFWFALTWACLIWYALITIYVGVRGAYDIRIMLSQLEAKRKTNDEAGRSTLGES